MSRPENLWNVVGSYFNDKKAELEIADKTVENKTNKMSVCTQDQRYERSCMDRCWEYNFRNETKE